MPWALTVSTPSETKVPLAVPPDSIICSRLDDRCVAGEGINKLRATRNLRADVGAMGADGFVAVNQSLAACRGAQLDQQGAETIGAAADEAVDTLRAGVVIGAQIGTAGAYNLGAAEDTSRKLVPPDSTRSVPRVSASAPEKTAPAEMIAVPPLG